MSAAKEIDLVHTGPGTLAGRYLRRFWQPIYVARELLPGHAKPVRIMGEDLTLYRGNGGQPHLVAFRCAHRGTQLSTGWVEGDCIRCFYHGWKYDSSGQCVEMPAEDPTFPPKVRIKSYPTREYLGLIFAYLGEGEPPPLRRYPEFEQPGVIRATIDIWPCNYFQGIENYVDHTHVAFVHRESPFSEHGLIDVPKITVEETSYGIVVRGTRANGVTRVNHMYMPNSHQIKVPPLVPGFGWADLLSWVVPIDDTHHARVRTTLTCVTGQAAEEFTARYDAQAAAREDPVPLAQAILAGKMRLEDITAPVDTIVLQDLLAQVGQGPITDRDQERLGRGDVGVILLRKLWMEELSALAEGRPLREWSRPERVEATIGVAD